jgi:hypothetical protein
MSGKQVKNNANSEGNDSRNDEWKQAFCIDKGDAYIYEQGTGHDEQVPAHYPKCNGVFSSIFHSMIISELLLIEHGVASLLAYAGNEN